MICLKNRTFAVSQTTDMWDIFANLSLWFAWKIVLLQYRKQPTMFGAFVNKSCDLLEKSYFCSIANNLSTLTFIEVFVVICLKNRTFAVSQTTLMPWSSALGALWFAWKIVLLQYRKQRPLRGKKRAKVVICLKNRTFAVSQTTSTLLALKLWWVVICLKNRTFAVSQTT